MAKINRDLNFFNEDVSWVSIGNDLFNKKWDILLTDVNTHEIYKIIAQICLLICKNTCSGNEKSW